ncbi:hypothetical protein ACHAXN_005398 [Cyclotella atomus]
MRSITELILLAPVVQKAFGFHLQPLRSAAGKCNSGNTWHITALRSSFTDLSGRDDQDEKIQILLDSLDSLRTAPKEPDQEPVQEDPMDDMVEKMAMPLKFFKGKEQDKKSVDKSVATNDNASDEQNLKVVDDSGGSSPTAGGVDVKADESTAVAVKPTDDTTSSTSAELPKEASTTSKASTAPAATEDTPTKSSISAQMMKTKDEQPLAKSATATILAEDKLAPIKATKPVETKDSSAGVETQSSATEEKYFDDSLFRKIFERPQVIDQSVESKSSRQSTSTSNDAEASIDSNFKALFQIIQPPTLPSFAPPDFGSLEFGLVGGAIVIISLYLSLAAYLRGVDKDEGYAEWDQYKRKEPKETTVTKEAQKQDIDVAMNAAVSAVKDSTEQTTPYGLANKGQNPFMTKPVEINTNAAAAKASAPKASATKASVTVPSPPKPIRDVVSAKALDTQTNDHVAQQLERLNKLEKDAASIESIIAGRVIPSSAGSIEVQKIEEYCEPAKVNPECSESISDYLGSVSKQEVEEGAQKVAAQKIISYLDSLSTNPSKQEPVFRGTLPTKAKVVAKKEPSRTSAAFSSYLDALSSGSVQEAPSAKAVAGYLEMLTTESTKVDNRIVEVEDRLNRLESSVASLPDNIASRLIEWQTRQDKKMNDEIEKIKMYLMEEASDDNKDKNVR